MFPWFLLVLRLKHGGLWKKLCCGEAGRVQRQAAFHQDGGRFTAPRAEHHAKMSAGFYLKCCCPTAPPQSGAPAPLAGVAQQTCSQSAPWLAGLQRRQSTLDQVLTLITRRMRPQGWVLYPQQAGPSWPWRGPWVSTGTCKPQTRSSPAAPAR